MTRPGRHTPISQRFTSQANERPSSPCERLWREVIDLAFREAVQPPKVWYGVKNPKHLETLRTRLQHEARDWLLSGGQDFVTVCDLAGRNPAEVRQMARRLLSASELKAAFAAAPRVKGPRYAGPKEQPA